MVARNSTHYLYYEKVNRRSRRFQIAAYIFLGLLAAATGVVVYYALTR